MKHTCLVLIGVLATAAAAPAALVSQDSSFGTNSITLDTVTGLQWLDLTVTAGVSWDSMQVQLGTTYAGWRYATEPERLAFFQHAGIPDLFNETEANYWPVRTLMELLGGGLDTYQVTNFYQQTSAGFFGSPTVVGGALRRSETPTIAMGWANPNGWAGVASNVSYPQFGHWLVQESSAVPEPGTMALAALGLAAAAWRRRRA